MPVRSTPIFIQGNSHPAEETRLMLAGMLGSVTGSFAGGVASSDPAHGVVRATDLAVTQNGTPNMTVNVAAGGCFIRGTQSANQGAYHLWNDGTLSVAISAADATNPRRDLIIAQARDANYSGASSDARIIVVTGTPAASPVDPSLSSFPNSLVLARVAVAAGDTSIVTAEITDLRTVANQIGKIPTYNSSALATVANPSPVDGQAYYLNLNTIDEGPYFFNGSQYRRPWNMPWGTVAHFSTTSSFSTFSLTPSEISAAYRLTVNTATNRRLRFTWTANYANVGGGGLLELYNATTSAAVGRFFQQNSTIGDGVQNAGVFVGTSPAVPTIFTLRFQAVVGGTFQVNGAASASQFTIEDIGPSGAPS
jgi:hypothetical protein